MCTKRVPRVLAVTLIRCGLHQRPIVRENLHALGLKKLHETRYHKNIPEIRGKLRKVAYLL